MTEAGQPAAVRDRILRVAADLFVAQGFKATSVRKICEGAGANVSMVNYYFRSKEELYLAVLDFARQQELKATPTVSDVANETLTPEDALRCAIETFLKNLLLPGHHSLLTKLIARELIDPSAAIEAIIRDDIRPQHRYFSGLIRAIAGPEMSEGEVQKCIFSIIGQALFYSNNRPINEVIAPDIQYDENGIEQIAEHIHRFTLAALQHYQNR